MSWLMKHRNQRYYMFGAETVQPLCPFAGLPDKVSPVLESFSNINTGPKALA